MNTVIHFKAFRPGRGICGAKAHAAAITEDVTKVTCDRCKKSI